MSKSSRQHSFLGSSSRHESVLPVVQTEGLNLGSKQLNVDIPFQRLGISRIEFNKLPAEGKALYLMAATTFLVAGVLPGLQGGVDIDPGPRHASGNNHTGGDIFSWGDLDHSDHAALSGINLVLGAYEKIDPLIANTHQIEVNTAAKIMRIKTDEPLDGGISELAQIKNNTDAENGVPLKQRLLDTYLMANHFYKMKDGSYAHIGFTENGSMVVNKGFTVEQARDQANLPKFIERVKEASVLGFWQDPPIAPEHEVVPVIAADRIMPLEENFGEPVIKGDIVGLSSDEEIDSGIQMSIDQALRLFDEEYADGRQYEPFRFSVEDAFGNSQHVFVSVVKDMGGEFITPTPGLAESIPISDPGNWYFYVEANESGQLVPPGSGSLEAGGLWIPLRAWGDEGKPGIIYYGISIPAENAAGEKGEVHTPIFSFEGLPSGDIKFTFIDPFSDETFSTTNPGDNDFFASQTASLDPLIGLPTQEPEGFQTGEDGNVQVFENGKWVELKPSEGIWGPVYGTSVVLVDDGEGGQEAFTQMKLEAGFKDGADGDGIVNVAKYNEKTKEWEGIGFTIARLPQAADGVDSRNYYIRTGDASEKIGYISAGGWLMGLKVEAGEMSVLLLHNGRIVKVKIDEVGIIDNVQNRTPESVNPKNLSVGEIMEILSISQNTSEPQMMDVWYSLAWEFVSRGAEASDCEDRSGWSGPQFLDWCKAQLSKGDERKIPTKAQVEQGLLFGKSALKIDSNFSITNPNQLWSEVADLEEIEGSWLRLNVLHNN